MTSCRRKKSIEITVWAGDSLPFYQHYEKWNKTGAAIGCSRKCSRKTRMRQTVDGCHSNDQHSALDISIADLLVANASYVGLTFLHVANTAFFYKVVYSELGCGPWGFSSFNTIENSVMPKDTCFKFSINFHIDLYIYFYENLLVYKCCIGNGC